MSEKPVVKPTEDEKFLAWVKRKIKISKKDNKCCGWECIWFVEEDDCSFASCDLFMEFLSPKHETVEETNDDTLLLRVKKCLKLKR